MEKRFRLNPRTPSECRALLRSAVFQERPVPRDGSRTARASLAKFPSKLSHGLSERYPGLPIRPRTAPREGCEERLPQLFLFLEPRRDGNVGVGNARRNRKQFVVDRHERCRFVGSLILIVVVFRCGFSTQTSQKPAKGSRNFRLLVLLLRRGLRILLGVTHRLHSDNRQDGRAVHI